MTQGKKIAIVGGASSRRHAPYDDPSWDIWAFSSLKVSTPRITRWFEMHALGDLRQQLRGKNRYKRTFPEYMAFLGQLDCPVYMQRRVKEVPTSTAYPLKEAVAMFGRCFTSTASYLIALAIMEGASTIGVWGVHLVERTVYARQRPGVEYLLGKARQQGVEVVIPPGCPLKVPARPRFIPTPVLYGYDWQSPGAWWRYHLGRRRFPQGRREIRKSTSSAPKAP